MDGLLDDEALAGQLPATIVFRPEREAVPILRTEAAFEQAISTECQIWGGATSPIFPIEPDGSIPRPYQRMLAGSAVDGIRGSHPYWLHYLDEARIILPFDEQYRWSHLAMTLLEYRPQGSRPTVEVVVLEPDDPWRGIYLACLGTLPPEPNATLMRNANLVPDLTFEDFFDVERVLGTGSLEDLISRQQVPGRATPRLLSMVHLAVGDSASTALRHGSALLPDQSFARFDAGPNVLVVCTPGSVEDLALLWNLRGAHGDLRPIPIGIPLAEVGASSIDRLLREPRLAHHGIAAKNLYVTSASVPVKELQELVGSHREGVAIAASEALLTFGSGGGWFREEVLSWKDGRSLFVPLHPDSHQELFDKRVFARLARNHYRVYLPDCPLPAPDDLRLGGMGHDFVAGAWTSWGITENRTDAKEIWWPTRMRMAKAVASHRGLELTESAPGAAGRLALQRLSDIGWLSNVAHAPLLRLLEEMATRQGFGWYKDRLREAGIEADPVAATAPSVDDMQDKGLGDFKKVLGNNERATKYWLWWAERAHLIIKGFSLTCDRCGAKQWLSVAAFSPPPVCRACAATMDMPFGDRPVLNFRYRIGEPLRRIYAQDAMGHLLVARHFSSLLGIGRSGRLIGVHPGMEVRPVGASSALGEADVLLFTKKGDFIPIEVKRSASGLTPNEILKLESLADLLRAPWSAVAACQYAKDTGLDLDGFQERALDGTYRRILLTYDALLEPFAVWSLGADPFAWRPLTPEQVADRESKFVASLADQAIHRGDDWQADEIMRKPDRPR